MAAEAKTIVARASPSVLACCAFCGSMRLTFARPGRDPAAPVRLDGGGDALPDSDVDLIAEIDRTMSLSLLDLVGVQDRLRDLLNRKIDFGTTTAKMRPRMRQGFEAEAIEVF